MHKLEMECQILQQQLINERQEAKLRHQELEDILKDFLTTKECSRTWVDEMHGTIRAVLGGE